NKGHRPGVKGGYFPVPPVDSAQDIRSEMCLVMEQMGLVVEAHVFCRYAYSRQNRRCERNKNKCLAGSKPCSHNQMMNMLAIRGK
ncbi:hypothetical protein MJN69_27355, partial [Salmonella enterica subsp. enterica serovar Kentucky]|nr:hypothetical protein [Salmonella enterica subsp. enterica serovar Kentucky]